VVRTLDEGLPLFPTDKQIAWALFGSDKDEYAKSFLSKIPHLEHDGFPRKSVVYGRRYWPAVRAYLDYRMGLRDAHLPHAEDGRETWDDVPDGPRRKAAAHRA
jgi:hypothetical protein